MVYHETFNSSCRDDSHPHQTVFFYPWIWVVDLGCDTIWHYKLQGNSVEKVGSTLVNPGSGPRHMVINRERGLAFVVCELKSLVAVFR